MFFWYIFVDILKRAVILAYSYSSLVWIFKWDFWTFQENHILCGNWVCVCVFCSFNCWMDIVLCCAVLALINFLISKSWEISLVIRRIVSYICMHRKIVRQLLIHGKDILECLSNCQLYVQIVLNKKYWALHIRTKFICLFRLVNSNSSVYTNKAGTFDINQP